MQCNALQWKQSPARLEHSTQHTSRRLPHEAKAGHNGRRRMAFHNIDANQRLACPPSEEAVSPSKNPLTEAQGYLAACSISLRYAASSTVTAEPDMLKGGRGNNVETSLHVDQSWAGGELLREAEEGRGLTGFDRAIAACQTPLTEHASTMLCKPLKSWKFQPITSERNRRIKIHDDPRRSAIFDSTKDNKTTIFPKSSTTSRYMRGYHTSHTSYVRSSSTRKRQRASPSKPHFSRF